MLFVNVWKKFQALPTGRDKLFSGIFVLGLPCILIHELVNVIPHYIQQGTFNIVLFPLHILFALFSYYNVYGNLYHLMTIDIITQPISHDKSTGGPSTRYCEQCSAHVPSRSHHCPLCRVCVERRDHHCWFSGTCVGARNYRHYLVMIVNAWLAGLYASCYNLDFVLAVLGTNPFYLLLCVVAPHCLVVLGYFSVSDFIVACLTSISVVLMLLLSFMICLQLLQLTRGQTAYERKTGDTRFHRGHFWRNLQEILGHRYLAVWVAPFCHSQVDVAAQLKPSEGGAKDA